MPRSLWGLPLFWWMLTELGGTVKLCSFLPLEGLEVLGLSCLPGPSVRHFSVHRKGCSCLQHGEDLPVYPFNEGALLTHFGHPSSPIPPFLCWYGGASTCLCTDLTPFPPEWCRSALL